MEMDSLLNNIELMFSVFILIPSALAILITYKIFCKNYGNVVNKPLWKKIVEAFLGLIFFSLVIFFLIYYYSGIKKTYDIYLYIIISFVTSSCFIILEHFIPSIYKKIEIKNNLNKESRKKINNKDRGSLIERLGNKKTVDYIRAIIAELSINISICYFIITIILLILNEFVILKELELLIAFWNNILAIFSSFSVVSFFHTIISSINSNDDTSTDTTVDQVKKRLLD